MFFHRLTVLLCVLDLFQNYPYSTGPYVNYTNKILGNQQHKISFIFKIFNLTATQPSSSSSSPLSRHPPLSSIAPGRSFRTHPVSAQSCSIFVLVGRPTFPSPYAGVHGSTSHMSSSLLLQQCPACLFRLTLIVFVTGGRWPYSSSWTCLIQLAPFLRSCRQGFSPYV